MAIFTQTRHRTPGRFLQAKIWLFSVAAVIMLVGMARGLDFLIGIAIALLAVAFVLRFFEKEAEEETADEEEYDDDDYAGDEPDASALPSPADEMRAPAERPATQEPRRPAD